jgi:AcrR family transcriptional regulator
MSDIDRTARLAVITREADARESASAERRVTRRGLMSRDRIIEEAKALLAEGGYPALSISAVCKRAEVSAASLYHHFGDKAGLCAAIIEESIASSARQFVEIISDHDKPLPQLQAYIDATRQIGREAKSNVISVLAALAQARSDAPEVAEAIEKARAAAWRFAAAEFADSFGVKDGMLFTHLQFAFASYIDHVAQSSSSKDDARALYASYRRILLITAAAIRPDFLADKDFAAALAEASTDGPPQHSSSKGKMK